MDLRREKVLLETDRYRVEGDMTVPATGFRSRLSDHVNRGDLDFLTVQDAHLTPFDGSAGWDAEVLMVAVRHVRLLCPAGDGPAT